MSIKSVIKGFAAVATVAGSLTGTAMADEKDCSVDANQITSFQTVEADGVQHIVAMDQNGEGVCNMTVENFANLAMAGKAPIQINDHRQEIEFTDKKIEIEFKKDPIKIDFKPK